MKHKLYFNSLILYIKFHLQSLQKLNKPLDQLHFIIFWELPKIIQRYIQFKIKKKLVSLIQY